MDEKGMRTDDPAYYKIVSNDMTKQQFSYKGKDDYSNAADLYRDMHYAAFGTQSSEKRDRGWEYLLIWIGGDTQYKNSNIRSFAGNNIIYSLMFRTWLLSSD